MKKACKIVLKILFCFFSTWCFFEVNIYHVFIAKVERRKHVKIVFKIMFFFGTWCFILEVNIYHVFIAKVERRKHVKIVFKIMFFLHLMFYSWSQYLSCFHRESWAKKTCKNCHQDYVFFFSIWYGNHKIVEAFNLHRQHLPEALLEAHLEAIRKALGSNFGRGYLRMPIWVDLLWGPRVGPMAACPRRARERAKLPMWMMTTRTTVFFFLTKMFLLTKKWKNPLKPLNMQSGHNRRRAPILEPYGSQLCGTWYELLGTAVAETNEGGWKPPATQEAQWFERPWSRQGPRSPWLSKENVGYVFKINI